MAVLFRMVDPQPLALRIRSDEHQARPRDFRDLAHDIEQLTLSSRRGRTERNPLFAVDLFDDMVRHGSANHEREIIAFSKRRQSALERTAIKVVWRNPLKRRAATRLDSPTPATALGFGHAPPQGR